MKELSIEQKAKRYDEAIKLAKDSFNYPDYPGFIRADVVFPEIKESENEKIRKELLAVINGLVLPDEQKSRFIAWLEKQGKQKSVDKVEPIFNIGDTIAKKHNSDIHDFGSFTITDMTGGKYWYNDRIICDITEQDNWEIYEPIRQNSVKLSEEDEKEVAILKGYIYSMDWSDRHIDRALSIVDELVNKVKSSNLI